MSEQHIEGLLHKYSDGTCTPQEQAQVDSLYDYILRNTTLEDALEDLEHKYFYRLRKRHTRSTYRKMVALAAAALVAVVIGLMFLFRYQARKEERSLANHIAWLVDSGKPVLKLPDGKIIVLKEADDGLLSNFPGGTVTKQKGKTLTFASNDKLKNSRSESYELFIPKGSEYHLTLADGSSIQVNAATHIRFDPLLNDKERNVEVNGEAFFIVHKESSAPFTVSLRNQKLRVMGTRFNARNYPDEPTKTTVTNGKVLSETKTVKGIERIEVSTSQQVVFNQIDAVKYENVDTLTEVGWKQGLFVFSQTPIKEALRQLSRWYNVTVDETNLRDAYVVAQFPKTETLSSALGLLNASSNITLQLQGNRIVAK
jgi:hypothetical protein